MSAEKDQEHFCDGLTEELLNVLTRIPGLRVASRTSCFAFKGKDPELSAVAEKLSVAHVLEGSVRKAGNRVRITAQLIEVATDSHLWSESYNRELDDIFAIQEDIANRILDVLKRPKQPPTAPRHTNISCEPAVMH
jgi:serine/threonine-protein kinase